MRVHGAGADINGDLNVQEKTKTGKLQLGDKFLLSGVGDAHANDGWLRLFNKDGGGYYGGLAVGELWSGTNSYLNGNTNVTGKFSTAQGISVTNPGVLIDKNYGSDSDRYGIGQFDNGATRVYAATKFGPATVNLSLAKNNNQFDDILTIRTDRTTNIKGPLGVSKDNDVPGDWTGVNAQRRDGRWTHLDWKDNGVNYLRGYTQVDDGLGVSGNVNVTGDIVTNGGNNWIIHTPDDGRRTMYIAPSGTAGNQDWNWG
jgi:hypothetical protein